MDLEEFIATTLKSIKTGVESANTAAAGKYFKVIPESKSVHFDIAVEIGKESKTGGGGGLKIQVVEGKLEKSSTSKESNTSRISFTVGINTIIS